VSIINLIIIANLKYRRPIMKKVSLLIMLLLFVGCAPTALLPEAEKVRIVRAEPGKECEYLGEVTGEQGGALTGAYTSNADLEKGALNDLKNKAVQMGGNLVFILTDRAGSTTDQSSGVVRQTNVVITGSVYRCPK
jgi:hypothetical protein